VLETELRPTEDGVAFVVRTSEPRYAEALEALVFTRAADEFIRVFPSEARDLTPSTTVSRLGLEELLEQTTGRRAAPGRRRSRSSPLAWSGPESPGLSAEAPPSPLAASRSSLATSTSSRATMPVSRRHSPTR
jgi:hypothetical protein